MDIIKRIKAVTLFAKALGINQDDLFQNLEAMSNLKYLYSDGTFSAVWNDSKKVVAIGLDGVKVLVNHLPQNMSFEDAEAFCKQQNICGNGCHLPTTEELGKMYNCRKVWDYALSRVGHEKALGVVTKGGSITWGSFSSRVKYGQVDCRFLWAVVDD